MKQKTYIKITTLLLFLITLGHAVRFLINLEVIIAGYVIPRWISLVIVIIVGFLAYSGLNIKKEKE